MDISLLNMLLLSPAVAGNGIVASAEAAAVQGATESENLTPATLFQQLLSKSPLVGSATPLTADAATVEPLESKTPDNNIGFVIPAPAYFPLVQPVAPNPVASDITAIAQPAAEDVLPVINVFLPAEIDKTNPLLQQPSDAEITKAMWVSSTPKPKALLADNNVIPILNLPETTAPENVERKNLPLPLMTQPLALVILPPSLTTVVAENKENTADLLPSQPVPLQPAENIPANALPLALAPAIAATTPLATTILQENAANQNSGSNSATELVTPTTSGNALLAAALINETPQKADMQSAQIVSTPDVSSKTAAGAPLNAVVLNSQIALVPPSASAYSEKNHDAVSSLKSVQLANNLLQKNNASPGAKTPAPANEVSSSGSISNSAIAAQEVTANVPANTNSALPPMAHDKIISATANTFLQEKFGSSSDTVRLLQNMPVSDQVILQIKSLPKNGDSHIRIQLDPAELGHVDVRMDVTKDGHANVSVTADNKHTLDLLQKDASVLQRALNDAGLKADSGSLSFNLRSGGGQQQGQDGRYTAFKIPAGYAALAEVFPANDDTPIIALARRYAAPAMQGLNITV